MTMHKVVLGAKPAPTEPTKPPRDVEAACAALRACATEQQLSTEFDAIAIEYESAGVELPLDIEAAHTECREALGAIPY